MHRAAQAIALAIFIQTVTLNPLMAQSNSAAAAARCTKEPHECPYFFDVFKNDKTFREKLLAALRKAGLRRPDWLPDGVATPFAPVEINGETAIVSTVGEPHNAPHHFAVVYYPLQGRKQGRLVGKYYSEEGEEMTFGGPEPVEVGLLDEPPG